MSAVQELTIRWRADAKILRQYRQLDIAGLVEAQAEELDNALRRSDEETVNLTAAARVSGYSTDHLGRLVRAGQLINYGRPNAPRVRLSDLPRKAVLPSQQVSSEYLGASRRQIATAITTSEGRGNDG